MENESVITVQDPVVDQPVGEELSPMELELAKKHKIDVTVKPDEKSEEKPVVKPVADVKKTDEKAEDSEIPVEELDSFEKLHDLYQAKPEAFYKLPKNVKQLYHSQKGLYKRMKDEEEKRKKVEDEAGLSKITNTVARIKLDRIKQRLAAPEGLTVEELQELLDEKKEVDESPDKPLTKKDLEDFENKKKTDAEKEADAQRAMRDRVNAKVKSVEEFGKANISDLTGGKYENFDDVVNLAQEVIKLKPRHSFILNEAFKADATEEEIADVLLDIAKLNPNYGSSVKTEKKSDETVEKIVKNAGKQQTSATLSGGRGSRDIHISEDMDPEDAAKVWDKIPRDIRHKILKKVH